MSIQDIAQAIDRALQALERLEQAIDAGNNIQIGAALYELRRELTALKNFIRFA